MKSHVRGEKRPAIGVMGSPILAHVLLSLFLGRLINETNSVERDDAFAAGCGGLHNVFAWSKLNYTQQRELFECYQRDETLVQSEGACGLFLQRDAWNWVRLGEEARAAVGVCLRDVALMDLARQDLALRWMPRDLLIDPLKPFQVTADALRAALVTWQWFSDMYAAPELVVRLRYESHWAGLGLNVSHYAALREDPSTLVVFRAQNAEPMQYYKWNNDVQPDAVLGFYWILMRFLRSV